jgi:hypothetical protein
MYYFMSYTWRTSYSSKWNFEHRVTTTHPMLWILEAPKKENRDKYVLISWQEITRKQALDYLEQMDK